MKRILYIILLFAFISCSFWAGAQIISDAGTQDSPLMENTDAVKKDKDLALVISPNPTTDNFSISNIDKIGKVEVYNIIGAKVKSFDTRESSSFDVLDLPSGIYLVRAYDKTNSSILSTLRLKKR